MDSDADGARPSARSDLISGGIWVVIGVAIAVGSWRMDRLATQGVPGFAAPANYFGIFIPKGVPDEVVKTVEKIWADNIARSEAIKKYATSRGALFAPADGEAAQKAVFPAIQANAWLLFNGGKAKVSPDTVGIAKP